MPIEAEPVLSVHNALGEGPLWHPGQRALYWVDIGAQSVHRWQPDGGAHEVFVFTVPVIALARRVAGGFLVATPKSLSFWNPPEASLQQIAVAEPEKEGARFNDGAVDPEGRFWIGTMKKGEATSSLYRLDANRTLDVMASGLTVSNGIGWSPDRRTMYLTDSLSQTIFAYDYDPASGSIDNRRIFVHTPDEPGVPDGLAVDSAGFVWSVRCRGWKIVRYDPQGNVAAEIRLPVECPTSCAFGGPDLDQLYVTSSTALAARDHRQTQPLAGDLFRIEAGVRGLPEPAYGG